MFGVHAKSVTKVQWIRTSQLPSAKVTESYSSEHVPSRLCLSTKFWAMKSWVDPESTRKTAFFPASFPMKRSNSCSVSVWLTRRLLISRSESWSASSSLSLLLLRVRCLSWAVLAAGVSCPHDQWCHPKSSLQAHPSTPRSDFAMADWVTDENSSPTTAPSW